MRVEEDGTASPMPASLTDVRLMGVDGSSSPRGSLSGVPQRIVSHAGGC